MTSRIRAGKDFRREQAESASGHSRDEGGHFEVGNQVLISNHRKLLSTKAMVVSVAVAHDQHRNCLHLNM
jgi:hypothetical protein